MNFLIFFGIIILFVIHFYLKRKRKKAKPFPSHWHTLLLKHVHFYNLLPSKKTAGFPKKNDAVSQRSLYRWCAV